MCVVWLSSDASDPDYEPPNNDQGSDSENVENESHSEPEAGPSTVKSPVKRGRPSKPFSELGKDAKLAKIDEEHKKLDSLTKKLDVPMSEVLGRIGRKHYSGMEKDPSKAKMFDKIAKDEDPFKDCSLSADKALFLKESLGAGRKKWDQLRFTFGEKDVPTNYAIDKLRQDLKPDHFEFENGVRFSLEEILVCTISRHLKVLNFEPTPDNLIHGLEAKVNLGHDGSGGHVQMQGCDIGIWTRNIIYGE